MTIRAAGRFRPLTPRELEVLAQLRTGIGNKHIAHALGIAEWTVKVHLTRIYTKLGVRNRVQAALAKNEALAGQAIARARLG